ncbi:MAG: acyltransferase [Nitrospiraceae bacterium]|nr:MAG: acyltransferase [Nitrospiraceae bacterium]
MIVGFYQLNPLFGDINANVEKVRDTVKNREMDLLVLPEFFATGYQFASIDEVADLSEEIPDGRTTRELLKLSHDKHMFVVAGLPEKDGDRYYNSAVLTGPDGFLGVYRKTHLFFEETLFFTRGDTGFKVWDIGICRLGIMICFDWFYPESMRALALKGADIIAHPSNLVLPFCPDAMPVRCLENMTYAITANRIGTELRHGKKPLTFIGKSEIVSPKGQILLRAPDDEEAVMITDLDPAEARDKMLNQYNNIINDRRPDMYVRSQDQNIQF